jgi:acyl carrier protein
MRDEEIIARLTDIFQVLFENNAIRLTLKTTPKEIRGWDSMANITLAMEVEQEFKIRIKPAEMASVGDVGDLAGLIQRHLPSVSR